MLRVASAFCLAAVAFGATGSSAAAVGIGTITDVVNQAFHTPPGGSELPANREDTLVADETLRTDKEASLSVLFIDGSELNIESESEVTLSDYVFDQQTESSTGTIQLNTGLFHFNSNKTEDSGIVLQTPVATIGIRGTEFLVTVASNATIVDILEGEVEVKSRGTGKSARCVGGQSALVAAQDADAICGDLGSFSTAAGLPSAPTTVASGEGGTYGIGRGAQPAARERPADAPAPDREPPAPGGGQGNRSGHDDGSNPGKGDGKGHDKNNGGNNNPGGSK